MCGSKIMSIRELSEEIKKEMSVWEYGILCILLGNDFVPHMCGVNIRKGGIEKIKKAKFENLVVAKNKPDDEDAQSALIRFTRGQLTDVIINQKLNIKVGKCYVNSNTEGNFNCVSCMILLYNRDKKDWQEAPNGRNFLKNSYDFYQPSEGSEWEAKDLSMQIPFDYALRKKYSAR